MGKCPDGSLWGCKSCMILMACGMVVVLGWVLTHLDSVIPPDRLSASIATAGVSAFMLMGASERTLSGTLKCTSSDLVLRLWFRLKRLSRSKRRTVSASKSCLGV